MSDFQKIIDLIYEKHKIKFMRRALDSAYCTGIINSKEYADSEKAEIIFKFMKKKEKGSHRSNFTCYI